MSRRKTLTIHVTEDEHRAFMELAEYNGVSITRLLRTCAKRGYPLCLKSQTFKHPPAPLGRLREQVSA